MTRRGEHSNSVTTRSAHDAAYPEQDGERASGDTPSPTATRSLASSEPTTGGRETKVDHGDAEA